MSSLLTPKQLTSLRNNGTFNAAREKRGGERLEFGPVVRFKHRDDGREWLLFEIDPADGDLVFAECRRPGREAERLWLHLSWLARQTIERTKHYGRIKRIPALTLPTPSTSTSVAVFALGVTLST